MLVSLISSRVGSTLTDSLTEAGVPHAVAGRLQEAKDAVAMGVAPVSDTMTAQLRADVTEGSHTAFMNGVHTAVLVTGILALIGAVLSALGLRGRKDGHDENDTEVPNPDAVPDAPTTVTAPVPAATASAAAVAPSSGGTPVSGHVRGSEVP